MRELISNASDACEKIRFLQTSAKTVYQPETASSITVTADENGNAFTDPGIGMTLKASREKVDAHLIGQFGVFFYSAFMVANSVTVLTRSHYPEEQGWCWTSSGAGGYEMEPVNDLPRGTKVTLRLTEDARKFLKNYELERSINRYSNFVQFPIQLDAQELAKWLKETLGGQVEEVRVTRRFIESPAAIFESDKFMISSRRRLLKSMKSNAENVPLKHDLEINPNHAVIHRLEKLRQENAPLATKVAEQILDNARIAASTLDDSRPMFNAGCVLKS